MKNFHFFAEEYPNFHSHPRIVDPIFVLRNLVCLSLKLKEKLLRCQAPYCNFLCNYMKINKFILICPLNLAKSYHLGAWHLVARLLRIVGGEDAEGPLFCELAVGEAVFEGEDQGVMPDDGVGG